MRTAVVLLPLALLACQRDVAIDPAQLGAFAPLPAVMASDANPITPAKVALGRRLYYETQLSADGKQSCNSCHPLNDYGAEHAAFSTGVKGRPGGRNAPTVYNAAGHIAQFWDGRAATVEEQAKGPILNPVEMAMPDARVVMARLARLPGYRAAFTAAFPGERNPMTYDNLGKAIGAFERQLVTPSRWDTFLNGTDTALTNAEKLGFEEFVAAGCQACHNGSYLGGTTFQKAGTARPWPDRADPGRYILTKNPADSLVFKVPGLRNVARTAPYFHDGQVARLDDAVRLMARHQLGRELTEARVAAVVTWLETLTGTIPAEYVAPPKTSD